MIVQKPYSVRYGVENFDVSIAYVQDILGRLPYTLKNTNSTRQSSRTICLWKPQRGSVSSKKVWFHLFLSIVVASHLNRVTYLHLLGSISHFMSTYSYSVISQWCCPVMGKPIVANPVGFLSTPSYYNLRKEGRSH